MPTPVADPRARALARGGREAEARTILEGVRQLRQTRYVPVYPEALVLVALRDTPAAFAALEQAVRDREHSIALLRVDPSLDPIRASDRFERLLSAALPSPAR